LRLERVLHIHYEQLCADPAAILADVERFLGLDRPFDREVVTREFPTHSMTGRPGAIQDFNAKSLARLTTEEIRTVSRVVGPQLEQLRYERLETAPSSPR
jgi:hypothetical protein